ncbi:repetin-like isoform X2 [Homarus americanus]|uniref:repetin-like isoform X2 n=1 Tax=Homarus americanus TaxID=6706 RepID=UPI001C47A2D7|nr:repetin-like isoform X2 [Homarus americanus]
MAATVPGLNRSWQSLKQHYRKYTVNHLQDFQLTDKELAMFRTSGASERRNGKHFTRMIKSNTKRDEETSSNDFKEDNSSEPDSQKRKSANERKRQKHTDEEFESHNEEKIKRKSKEGETRSRDNYCKPSRTDHIQSPQVNLRRYVAKRKLFKFGEVAKLTPQAPFVSNGVGSAIIQRKFLSRGIYSSSKEEQQKCTSDEASARSPHRPQQQSPHRPQQQSPHRPQQQSPHRPQEQSPHRPQQQSPHRPQQQSPHRPQQQSPRRPQQQSPRRPQEQSPRRPQEQSPHRPQEQSPHRPQEQSPHRPQEQSPHRPQEQSTHRPQEQSLHSPQEHNSGENIDVTVIERSHMSDGEGSGVVYSKNQPVANKSLSDLEDDISSAKTNDRSMSPVAVTPRRDVQDRIPYLKPVKYLGIRNFLEGSGDSLCSNSPASDNEGESPSPEMQLEGCSVLLQRLPRSKLRRTVVHKNKMKALY